MIDAERDLILNPLTVTELQRLADLAGGVDKILSTKSPKYRALQAEGLSQTQWIAAMAQEPRLIKRPLVERDDALYIGFQPEVWKILKP